MTSLRYPPTLRSLLTDERYEQYFRRNVKLPQSISPNPRWQVMAETIDGTWKRGMRHTAKEAIDLTLSLLEDETIRDAAIISRGKLFKAPSFIAEHMGPGEEWCGRCRRPTLFTRYARRHPALRHAPVIVEGIRRCYFCGIREDFK